MLDQPRPAIQEPLEVRSLREPDDLVDDSARPQQRPKEVHPLPRGPCATHSGSVAAETGEVVVRLTLKGRYGRPTLPRGRRLRDCLVAANMPVRAPIASAARTSDVVHRLRELFSARLDVRPHVVVDQVVGLDRSEEPILHFAPDLNVG